MRGRILTPSAPSPWDHVILTPFCLASSAGDPECQPSQRLFAAFRGHMSETPELHQRCRDWREVQRISQTEGTHETQGETMFGTNASRIFSE